MGVFGKYQVKPTAAPGGFDARPPAPSIPAPRVVRLGSGERFQLLTPQNPPTPAPNRDHRHWEPYQTYVQVPQQDQFDTLPYAGSRSSPRSFAKLFDDTASAHEFTGTSQEDQELFDNPRTADQVEQEILANLKIKINKELEEEIKLDPSVVPVNPDQEETSGYQISAVQVFEELRQQSNRLDATRVASKSPVLSRLPLEMPEPPTSPLAQGASPPIPESSKSQKSPFADPHASKISGNSADSHASYFVASPHALISFSPEDKAEAKRMLQITYTLQEIMESEYTYVKSLSLLGNYLLEPLLTRCQGFRITCTPLVNIDLVIRGLHVRHRRFLSRVATERDLSRLAEAIVGLVSKKMYCDYASCAELVLLLVNRQVRPFESGYVSNLQGFLERNQPGENRMDLSLHSLIQKPLGRVAKYGLFLSSLAKLSPIETFIKNAGINVNNTVSELNSEIKRNKGRIEVLATIAERLDVSPTKATSYQFYGLLNLLGTCTVSWRSCNKRGPSEIITRSCHVLVHERHVIVNDVKTNKLLFVASFANSQMIADANNSIEGGIYREPNKKTGSYEGFENFRGTEDYPLVMKLFFEKDGCQYELLFESDNADAHAALLRACERIPRKILNYQGSSGGDCYLGPPVAAFDINLKDSVVVGANYGRCYFRATKAVESRSGSRLQVISAALRRTFARQNS